MPLGASRLNFTVEASTFVVPPGESTPPKDERACESLPVRRSNVATTSSAVIGVPSWNFTPVRSLNVHVFAPSDGFQLSARRGMIFELLSVYTSCSPGMCEIESAPSDCSSGGSSEPSGMIPPTRIVPPERRCTRAGAANAASGPKAMSVVSIAPMPSTLPRTMNSRRSTRPSLNSSIR